MRWDIDFEHSTATITSQQDKRHGLDFVASILAIDAGAATYIASRSRSSLPIDGYNRLWDALKSRKG